MAVIPYAVHFAFIVFAGLIVVWRDRVTDKRLERRTHQLKAELGEAFRSLNRLSSQLPVNDSNNAESERLK